MNSFSVLVWPAWKAEVNDTSLYRSAQVKITGVGITGEK